MKEERQDKVVSVRFSEIAFQEVEAAAERKHLGVSTYIKLCVLEALDSEPDIERCI